MSKTLTDQYVSDTYTGILHSEAVLPETGQSTIYDGDGNTSSLKLGRACNGATICGKLTADEIEVDAITFNNNSLINKIYPIGSIYFSYTSSNPSTTIGGGWNRIANGRFIVGAGTGTDDNGDSDGFSVGENGGEYKHTLTKGEMPSHTHTGVSVVVGSNGEEYNLTNPTMLNNSSLKHEGDAHTSSTSKTIGRLDGELRIDAGGGGNSHNNNPPSFALYVWRRVS
jgi:hypothetical protein